MNVAFVGGTRFIGHWAAIAALEAGHQVSVLHRGVHRCEVPAARAITADRADPADLIRALRKAAPDVVVDTRALTRPHAEVTALACKILALPVVVLSSQDVYAQFGRLLGHPAPEPVPLVDESAPLTIPFPYRGIADHEGGDDYDKKEVERVFADALGDGLPGATILRLPATYGSRDPKRRFAAIVDALAAGARTLPCADGARWRWTHAHVRDVAHAIVLAAEQPAKGELAVFNVGEAETPTMRERAEAIAAAMGVSFEWVEAEVPDELSFLGSHPNDFVASSAKIRKLLGFSEITTEAERIADVISAS